MKKKMMLTALILLFVIMLAGCGCEHEWKEANCVNPKTCLLCEETQDAPLGHSWLAAACETAKTCEVCGETEGEPLGHIFADAAPDCENPKTCSSCGKADGEAKPHDWAEATTETPKTCTVCAMTEGDRIITDARFTTEKNQALFGKWVGIVQMPMETVEPLLSSYAAAFECLYYLDFHNDGTLQLSMGVPEDGAFMDAMQAYTEDLMYIEFANMGMDQAAADAAFQQTYGTTIHDYVAAELAKTDMNQIFGAFTVKYVYYADGDQLYLGLSWDGEMEADSYTLKDGKLYLPLLEGEETEFVSVSE